MAWLAAFNCFFFKVFKNNSEILIGHEIVGFENIPETGPALLIYYHGAFPIDFYYVYSKTSLYKNRRFKIVADNFLFKVPGKFFLCFSLISFVLKKKINRLKIMFGSI